MGKRFRKIRKRLAAPFRRTWRLQAMTVKVIITDTQGRVLVLRRSQTDPRRPGTWDLPGGSISHGEDPRVAALREAKEETGLLLAGVDPVDVLSSYRRDERKNARNPWRKVWGIIMIMECRTAMGLVTLSYEHDAFAWINPLNLSDMAPLDIPTKYQAVLLRWGNRQSEVHQ